MERSGDTQLTVGRDDVLVTHWPYVAGALAVLIAIAVFAVLWKIRRTFGMKE